MIKTVVISGISGQDGTLLLRDFLKEKTRIIGLSRKSEAARNTAETDFLEARQFTESFTDQLTLLTIDYQDIDSIKSILDEYKPDEFYHLAGISSVGYSIQHPAAAINSNVVMLTSVLEAVRLASPATRLFFASSGEIFGGVQSGSIVTESTEHQPINAYGLSKSLCHQICKLYRENYGLFISIGILFQHESVYRPGHFFFGRLMQSLVELYAGEKSSIEFGDLSVVRDIGLADEYVQGFRKALAAGKSDDYIFATGQTIKLRELVDQGLNLLGLQSDMIQESSSLKRNNDQRCFKASPAKAHDILGWTANTSTEYLLKTCLAYKLKSFNIAAPW